MKLRQKKTPNLSEEAYYLDFQNQQFKNPNRKPEPLKRPFRDSLLPSLSSDMDKSHYAEILSKFINNVNLAKHSQEINTKIGSLPKNLNREQTYKAKRLRKTSENTSFDEQKKAEYPKFSFPEKESQSRKVKREQKEQKSLKPFSTNKPGAFPTESSNIKKESIQQNIINNSVMGNSFNLTDYARFFQSPFFGFNPQLMNTWYQMNPYFKPDWENLPFFNQDMRNGLYRQLQIYERFKPRSSSTQIQKKSFPFTNVSQNQEQKIEKPRIEKRPIIIQPESKISPDKIFKRASYHVGIAYSIYMDNIQKEGKPIKNFSDIDPTRFAKKFKLKREGL